MKKKKLMFVSVLSGLLALTGCKKTADDVSMMEYVVEREVHGASYAHKIAVANVIVNRVLDSRFPGNQFERGYWDHTLTCAIWTLQTL